MNKKNLPITKRTTWNKWDSGYVTTFTNGERINYFVLYYATGHISFRNNSAEGINIFWEGNPFSMEENHCHITAHRSTKKGLFKL